MMPSDIAMQQRIDEFDWAAHRLGPQRDWPPALQMMLSVVLNSRFPMLIFWGPEFVQIYNDAYVQLFGSRHPAALGQRAQDCWPEIWDIVGPMLRGTYHDGEPVWGEDMPFILQRNDFAETAYFTFSYSRIGDSHEPGGVLCTNVETTASVTRELEFHAMADSLANIIYSHTPDGSIEWANSRWFEYTKLPEELATNMNGWAHILPPEDLHDVTKLLTRAFMRSEPYEAEIRIRPFQADESAYRWHLIRAVPVKDADGKIKRWAGSATDVHDRHLAEQALRENLLRTFDREHQALLAFQSAALLQQLPQLPGLSFDAIYEAAGADALIGGDWYDAFQLPDGRVVLSVGDVIGSGLAAAVTMAAVRQAIRGAAQVYPEPHAVLDAADRALRSEQPDRIVTAFLGIIDPLTRTLCYASAGHPPPMLRCADGRILELFESDLPLGLRQSVLGAKSRMLSVPDDSLLVLYTDGLTEATRDAIEGESKLRDALARTDVFRSAHPATAIHRHVLSEASDDVAIMTVRILGNDSHLQRWHVNTSDPGEASQLRHALRAALLAVHDDERQADDAELIFGELLGNVVRHTPGHAEIVLDLSSRPIVLHVLDDGPGFAFYPRLPHDSMSESGRGLYIIAKLAHDLSVAPRFEGGSHARVVLK